MAEAAARAAAEEAGMEPDADMAEDDEESRAERERAAEDEALEEHPLATVAKLDEWLAAWGSFLALLESDDDDEEDG